MSIHFQDKLQLFTIRTPQTAYAVQINPEGRLTNLHWGGMIPRDEDFPAGDMTYRRIGLTKQASLRQIRNEFTGWGGQFYGEPALKVIFADGVRDLELVYADHRISADGRTLVITLRDDHYALEVDLRYETFPELDIINRQTIIRNTGREAVTVESAQSAVWYLPDQGEYRLTHLASCWGREYEISRLPLTRTRIVLDSRSGVSNSHQLPYFALDEGGRATEESGQVWFGALQWSGNWKIAVEKDSIGVVSVTGGLNDFDFAWDLKPGTSLETPVFTAGYTTAGFGGASRLLHDYQRLYLNPRSWADKPLPVVFNAWAAFEFNINEQLMMALAEKAAGLGVELFVMDDGWFSTRDDEKSGLGDWIPSPTKFPHGLKPLIAKVNSLGMQFGLWVEPEMVNPDSELYRQHPDWILHFPTRERELYRHQCVLNLAREDVKQFIIDFLDDLLDNNNLAYLKWDMNRLFTQPGWPEAPLNEQKGFWYRYVRNFYAIFEHLNQKYPNVILENCCSGGLRADLGMTRYCTRVNRSDNQDPLDELKLHEGYTYINRSRSAGGGGHVSRSGSGVNRRQTSLRYKAHIAMLGSFAICLDLRQSSAVELAELTGLVRQQKSIRATVHLGDQYRLASARENPYACFEYVSRDRRQAVLLLYGQSMQFAGVLPRIRLAGLDPQAIYRVENWQPAAQPDQPDRPEPGQSLSGQALMEIGLRLTLTGDFDSRLVVLNQID